MPKKILSKTPVEDSYEESKKQSAIHVASLVTQILNLDLSAHKKLILIRIADGHLSLHGYVINKNTLHERVGISPLRAKQLLLALIRDDYVVVKDQSGSDLLLDIQINRPTKRLPSYDDEIEF